VNGQPNTDAKIPSTPTIPTSPATQAETPDYGHFWEQFNRWPMRDKVIAVLGGLRCLLRFYQFDSRELFIIERQVQVLKWKGGHIEVGRGVRLAMGSKLVCGGRLLIGPRVVVGPNTVIMCATEMRIGARCMISWNCSIFDSIGHRMRLVETGASEVEAPITIGDDVWIGPYSIIMKGVTIGNNCIIGAGSVVRQNVPPNSLVYGNPARRVATVERWER
jgi:acetyltransferase-like isoleucine patch superfamily enzyme